MEEYKNRNQAIHIPKDKDGIESQSIQKPSSVSWPQEPNENHDKSKNPKGNYLERWAQLSIDICQKKNGITNDTHNQSGSEKVLHTNQPNPG